MALRTSSFLVFKCFKKVESAGDWLTGAAGPVFITFACVLIGGGVVVFFTVIAPRLPLPILTIPICLLIALNLLGQYYLACTVRPGFAHEPAGEEATGWLWARKRQRRAYHITTPSSLLENSHGMAEEGHGDDRYHASRRLRERKCKKCGGMKPERAHHCRVCRHDVLKYDHHWINQCVGLGNERHFILFMAYFVLSCTCFVLLGYPYISTAFSFFADWPYWPQRTPFILIYILAAVLGLAVSVMLLWHLRLVMLGETTVESYDNDVYRRVAKERGEAFVNCYDLGWRRNLALFFNLEEYPPWTLLLPLRVAPYSDGRTWAKREGLDRHGGVEERDEMTDEEE